MLQTIEVSERYLDMDDNILDMCEELGIAVPMTFKYRRRNYNVNDIRDVMAIEGCDNECVLVFQEGYKVVILGHVDEIYIQLNDLWNGISEEENN